MVRKCLEKLNSSLVFLLNSSKCSDVRWGSAIYLGVEYFDPWNGGLRK